jgi:hypothetical protein
MKYLERRKVEALIFIILVSIFFGVLGHYMGTRNLLSTIMNTAHELLLNTVFYLMSITVLAGAFGQLLIEFGVVRLLEMIFAPLMRPLFQLPGVASLAALMTFFSDNPAIISLAEDKNFSSYFKRHELISLTNFGTAFGMGLIVITFMAGKGFFSASLIGFLGAIVGAMVSTRLMQYLIKDVELHKTYFPSVAHEEKIKLKSEGSVGLRFINSILDGGKLGVDIGLSIIPGVLIISTIIMIITYGPIDPKIGYQGLAFEGVPILPKLASYFSGMFRILFGFQSPEAIAFPITSLGSVGAALSLIPSFLERGIIGANEIAVFTAIGMCWSGFLSTHTAMLDSLGYRELTSKALFSHTIGGILAGIFAHYCFILFSIIIS